MAKKSVLTVLPYGDEFAVHHTVSAGVRGPETSAYYIGFYDTEELAIANAIEGAGMIHSRHGHDVEVLKTAVVYRTADNKGDPDADPDV